MKKDWTSIAAASGLGIPAPEMERAAAALDALEAAFRPLAESLAPEVDPAPVFRPAEDER